MALSFIGKPISLISHSDVRYRGILAGIDPAASTIQLSNVYSMGTEMRRPPTEFIPPVQEPYQYIIFRASEVKDLSVDEPAPLRSVHDDPAVLGASAPTAANGYSQYPPTVAQPVPQQQPQQQPYTPQQQQQPHPPAPGRVRSGGSDGRRTANLNGGGSVQTAAASLETVERAIGDLRSSTGNPNANTNNRANGGRRGGNNNNRDVKVGDIRVPTTDFDFEGSNARFDKSALAPPTSAKTESTSVEEGEVQEEDAQKAYNPGKSFFDSLSSSTQAPPLAQRGTGRGGRGGGRNRREEERERNVATFGEPGGVGLMGPGAYVGGWGGYGRRGGGRGRRNPPAQAGPR
ncbi:Scd6-like Sm domain-containing protein [Lactarius vividus]|nr:Scd6-like Sm domain-containing protein [Lactarius vividus]